MADYESKTKEGKCIFCEISSKNISPMGNGLIWEDDKFMAWLSPFPNTLGYTIIIPKIHYGSDVLDMPDEILSEFLLSAKKVSKLLENFFDDVGRVGLIMEGTGIDHAHIKLFPMHGTEHMKKCEWKQYSSNIDYQFEDYEGYISSHDGPQANLTELELLAKKIKDQSK